MKKMISLILAMGMLLTFSATVFAADMGVDIISAPETESDTVNLDDLKLNSEAEIDGWGTLKLTSFNYEDELKRYVKGYNNWLDDPYESGNEADYAILRMDITNTTFKDKDYLSSVTVRVVYDDAYEFGGWAYQSNFDNYGDYNQTAAIDSADQFAIAPMYVGHYIFGCTLPNAVVNSKKPLSMIIIIDGNELTYNIRK